MSVSGSWGASLVACVLVFGGCGARTDPPGATPDVASPDASGVVDASGDLDASGGVDASGDASPPSDTNPGQLADAGPWHLVGPAGGTIPLPSSLGTLDVPAGALATETAVSVAPADDVSSELFTAVSAALAFGPEGLVFQVPATVTLAFDPEALPPGTTASQVVVYWSSDGLVWEALPSVVDPVARRVSASVTHFSVGVAGVSLCGNGACAGGESCESCPGDCGACPCAGFGCPCDTSGDCDSQLCYEVDGEGLCTEACVEDCPAGWTCASGPRAGGDLLFVCVPDPCEPTDELCDGLDNDCNGQIDDLKGDCEVVNEWGTCKGTPKCQQTATICEGAAAEPEACDGADNDCDGEVDEGFADENGDGVADCLPICGDGTCNGGETCGSCSEDCGACCSDFGCPCEAANDCSSGLCVEGGGGTICTQPCVDSCPAPYVCKPYPSGPDLPYACLPDCDPKADELCDGLDNDCDGDVDEGFADTDKDGAADCVDDDDD